MLSLFFRKFKKTRNVNGRTCLLKRTGNSWVVDWKFQNLVFKFLASCTVVFMGVLLQGEGGEETTQTRPVLGGDFCRESGDSMNFSGKHNIVLGYCRKKSKVWLFTRMSPKNFGSSKILGGLKITHSVAQTTFDRVVTPHPHFYLPPPHLTNLQTFVWLGVWRIPPVIQTSVNFSFFNLHFLSRFNAWYAETLQGYLSKGALSSAGISFSFLLT